MNDIFMWGIALWTFIMLGAMTIGGYFMFRKFLKRMPKEDGYSELDWQEHYIDKALPLWNNEARHLLNELVSPVPELFRDVAKERIAGRISKIALDEKADTITLVTRISRTPRTADSHADGSDWRHRFSDEELCASLEYRVHTRTMYRVVAQCPVTPERISCYPSRPCI